MTGRIQCGETSTARSRSGESVGPGSRAYVQHAPDPHRVSGLARFAEGGAPRCAPGDPRCSGGRWVLAARVENRLDVGVVQILLGNQGGACVGALYLGTFADHLDGRINAVVAHAERILGYESGYDTFLDG